MCMVLDKRSDVDLLPSHIAIVMDGNGRWAKRRGMPRTSGHFVGMIRAKQAIQNCDALGIRYVTLFGWSTENWKRDSREVDYVMSLPAMFLAREIDELIARNVQFRFMGETSQLPKDTLRHLLECERRTSMNTGMVLNFAFNYGGRNDILQAAERVASDISSGVINPATLAVDMIEIRLMTKDVPDPELIIRTSGEKRLSNFFLWQMAHSELWFTDTLWPDFNRKMLHQAIDSYIKRKQTNE